MTVSENTLVSILVSANTAGMRLDHFLAEQCRVSRRLAKSWCLARLVRVNHVQVKPGRMLMAGDLVEVITTESSSSEQDELERERLKAVRILHEDSDILVLSKPRQVHSVGIKSKNEGVSLATWLYEHYPEVRDISSKPEEATLVQRLDYFTSGIVLAGRSSRGLEYLRQTMRRGNLQKSYLALLAGEANKENTINSSIYLVPGANRVYTEKHGKKSRAVTAVSTFTPLSIIPSISGSKQATVVLIKGQSMRRHQVRVHAFALGHPLVGDEIYGGPESGCLSDYLNTIEKPEASGFFLHAYSISIADPQGGMELNLCDPASYLGRWFKPTPFNPHMLTTWPIPKSGPIC